MAYLKTRSLFCILIPWQENVCPHFDAPGIFNGLQVAPVCCTRQRQLPGAVQRTQLGTAEGRHDAIKRTSSEEGTVTKSLWSPLLLG